LQGAASGIAGVANTALPWTMRFGAGEQRSIAAAMRCSCKGLKHV
jgi:hypothetical protein